MGKEGNDKRKRRKGKIMKRKGNIEAMWERKDKEIRKK